MFIDNNWYGNRYILSKYSKVIDKAALASLQHGMLLSNFSTGDDLKGKKSYGKRTFEYFPWLVWNDYIYKKAKNFNVNNVHVVGAPIIYVDKILKKKKFSKPKGTLIFPSKSAYGVGMEVDYIALYKFVKKKFKPPFTIAVSYFDLKRVYKIRHTLKDCKFVTFGKRGNKFFTFKLYKYLKEHKSTVSFYPGSPILYSLFLRKKTFYFSNRFLKNLSGKYFIEKNSIELEKIRKEDILIANLMKKEYSLNLSDLNKKINFKKVDMALGKNRIKSPNYIIKILGWSSNYKSILAKILYYLMNLKYQKAIPRKI